MQKLSRESLAKEEENKTNEKKRKERDGESLRCTVGVRLRTILSKSTQKDCATDVVRLVSPNETFGDVNKKTEAMIVSVDSVGVCRWWCCINYMIYAVD